MTHKINKYSRITFFSRLPSTPNEPHTTNVFSPTLEHSTFEELATDIIESTLVKSQIAVNNSPNNLVTVPEEIKRIDELEGEKDTQNKSEGDHEVTIQNIHTEIEMGRISNKIIKSLQNKTHNFLKFIQAKYQQRSRSNRRPRRGTYSS